MHEDFTHLLGYKVCAQIPHTMSTEVVVHENAPHVKTGDESLVHRMDKPFRVHQIVLRLTALDEHGAVIDPQPTVLDRFITMRLFDSNANELIANGLPFRQLSGGELVWTPMPLLLMRRAECLEPIFHGRESFAITGVNTQAFAITGVRTQVKAIRVQISLEGVVLLLESPDVTDGNANT